MGSAISFEAKFNSATIAFNNSGKMLAIGVLENLQIWDIQDCVLFKTILGPKNEVSTSNMVTIIIYNYNNQKEIAVGYQNGFIRIWDEGFRNCIASICGYYSTVLAIKFSFMGSLVASGSYDSVILIWNLKNESDNFKLYGHKGIITDLVFITKNHQLISSCSDKSIKIWDVEKKICFQTLSNISEIWSLDVDPKVNWLVTGSSDSEVSLYRVNCLENFREKKKFQDMVRFNRII